jgi:hypothetical protein
MERHEEWCAVTKGGCRWIHVLLTLDNNLHYQQNLSGNIPSAYVSRGVTGIPRRSSLESYAQMVREV